VNAHQSSEVVSPKGIQPIRFPVYDILGWTHGFPPDDASVEDVVEFVEMACGDILHANHEWLQAEERSTNRIRDDLFGIYPWSRFCDWRLRHIINRAMREEGYQSRGDTPNQIWSPLSF